MFLLVKCPRQYFVYTICFFSWMVDYLPPFAIVDGPIQWVRDAFDEIAPRLERALEKDSVRHFLRLFESVACMQWNLTITAETLTYVVIHNALRCIEGQGS